jgi:hypothetical protein
MACPDSVAPAMMAKEMSVPISPYSMDVAPEGSFAKRREMAMTFRIDHSTGRLPETCRVLSSIFDALSFTNLSWIKSL